MAMRTAPSSRGIPHIGNQAEDGDEDPDQHGVGQADDGEGKADQQAIDHADQHLAAERGNEVAVDLAKHTDDFGFELGGPQRT